MMKRIEMIRHMAWTWKSYISKMDKNTDTPLKDACTYLLDSMEREGMLTPGQTNEFSGNVVHVDNYWEPEENEEI